MVDRCSFGIGCFHFGIKKKPPFKFKGSDYIKELHTALKYLSNINNIKIHYDPEFEDEFINVSEELPNIGEDNGFFPKPISMIIEFKLDIPFKIQAQLLKTEVSFLKTFTEKFQVSIHYTYHLPVTFIEPINPSQKSNPSDAVIIICRFLKQEFKSSKSDYIQFEFLGPSPFQADCYIKPGKIQDYNNLDWNFQFKAISQKGYDKVILYFNPKIFTEVDEAKEIIFRQMRNEWGFFYNIVQLEVVKINDWTRIQSLVEQLISIQQVKGIKGFLKKLFALSKVINEAFISIVGFKNDELFFNNIRQKDYRDIYTGKKEQYFQSYIDKQIDAQFIYPTEEMSKLISFFEGQRIKIIENFTILISAIIGGVIGSLLTILLSK